MKVFRGSSIIIINKHTHTHELHAQMTQKKREGLHDLRTEGKKLKLIKANGGTLPPQPESENGGERERAKYDY
jgi:hypothetical protein